MANNSDYKDFVFFDTYLHAAVGLTEDEQNELFRKIMVFGTSKQLVKRSDNVEAVFWPLVKTYVKDNAKRDLKRERKRQSGKNVQSQTIQRRKDDI